MSGGRVVDALTDPHGVQYRMSAGLNVDHSSLGGHLLPIADIMVVDDESVTAKHIESVLVRLGYRVLHVASSGEEALEKAATTRPDLVLMDISLTGELDGIQAAELLRSRHGIRVVYVTAFTDDEVLARAQIAAPLGYLVKPFNERELHATIQTALQTQKLERQAAESQRWLQTILGAIGDGIIATNSDGQVRFMSRAAEALTGWREAEAMNQPLARIFRTSPLGDQRHPRAGEPEEVSLRHRSGKEQLIEITASTATDDNGQINGFVWAFRDISGRKRAEEELSEKELYFRSLIEQTSDVITVVDQDGTIHYASPSLETVLGYDPADVLGKSILEALHPDDLRGAVLSLGRIFAGKRIRARLEIRVRHQDGSWRVMESAGSRRADLHGEPRIILSSRDVTERKNAEDRLNEELDTSAALARMSQQLIAVLGSGDLLNHLCRLTTEILQCDFSHTWLLDEGAGMYLAVADYGDSPEQWESLQALRLPLSIGGNLIDRTDKEDVTEFLAGRGDDLVPPWIPARYGIASCLYMALRRRGRMVGLQAAGHRARHEPFSQSQRQLARRIAHLASLALEQARLVEELDSASRLKSDLMATLSHELRTNLTTIVSVIQLLIEEEFGSLNPEQMERLRLVERATRQMAELIQSTLDLGRAERKQLHLDLRDVLVADLIAEIERESESLWKERGVTLTWKTEPGLPVLLTDRMKLKVVLKNLVGNALKFTKEGSVTFAARACGGGIEFSVKDTGPGIAPEAQSTIFEPYRQAVNGETQSRNGIGLGLYIVRQLLESLGGAIALESELGAGSTFRVWVPVTPARQPHSLQSDR